MKNLIIIITIFTVQIVLSQSESEYHVKYSLKYKINLNVAAYNEEHFDLIGNDEKSFYEGRHKFISDSMLFKSELESKAVDVSSLPRTNFYNTISKIGNSVLYSDVIAGKALYYKERISFKWNYIADSTKIIQGYNCKMAVTKYGGRNWKAWYTTDIPIQNGPSKFSGLPGLILEISDSKSHYIFKVLNISFKPLEYNRYDTRFKKKEGDLVTRNDFIKIRNIALSNWDNYQRTSGVKITNEDPMVSREISNRMKSSNNFLELE